MAMGVGLTKATLTFTSKVNAELITVNDQKKTYANSVDFAQKLSEKNGDLVGTLFNKGDQVSGINSKIKSIREAQKGGVQSAVQAYYDEETKKSEGNANFLYGDESTKTLTFQFNPSTLRISAYGGGLTTIADYNRDDKNPKTTDSGIRYGPIPANISVDFKVIFDAETNTDAFMMDRYAVNATNLVKQGTQLATGDSWVGENNYIRQIVEGFLATLRNSKYRRVTFAWNHLQYSGDLNSVQCQYTMFNPKGEPIRAEVSLRILASGKKDGNGYTSIWKERYEELIKAVDEKGASSLTGNWFGDSKAFNPISW